jgi:hypothetical protein
MKEALLFGRSSRTYLLEYMRMSMKQGSLSADSDMNDPDVDVLCVLRRSKKIRTTRFFGATTVVSTSSSSRLRADITLFVVCEPPNQRFVLCLAILHSNFLRHIFFRFVVISLSLSSCLFPISSLLELSRVTIFSNSYNMPRIMDMLFQPLTALGTLYVGILKNATCRLCR